MNRIRTLTFAIFMVPVIFLVLMACIQQTPTATPEYPPPIPTQAPPYPAAEVADISYSTAMVFGVVIVLIVLMVLIVLVHRIKDYTKWLRYVYPIMVVVSLVSAVVAALDNYNPIGYIALAVAFWALWIATEPKRDE